MDEKVVDFEQNQYRASARSASVRQFKKTEISDVAGHSTLVLATAFANAVVLGLEMRERKKLRRLAYMIVGGMLTALGLLQLTIHLIHLS